MRDIELLKPEFPLLAGLRPQCIWVLGQGYSREELKAHVLSAGYPLSDHAIINLEELSRLLIQQEKKVLSAGARELLYRRLLSIRQISKNFPQLNRLKRQKGFYRRLDQALQKGVMTFAHEEEYEVQNQRLMSGQVREGLRPLRLEVQAFHAAYWAWLREKECADLPLLLSLAAEQLNQNLSKPAALKDVKIIRYFSISSKEELEAREQYFWNSLQNHVELQFQSPEKALKPVSSGKFVWQQWHSMDDAADALSLELQDVDWSRCALFMPDQPELRRTLMRALRLRGLPLADPRDPTQLKWDERIKTALLPLRMLAFQYRRDDVLDYLRFTLGPTQHNQVKNWAKALNDWGVSGGKAQFQRGPLPALFLQVSEIEKKFTQRMTCQDLIKAHLEWIQNLSNDPWLLGGISSLWRSIADDHLRVLGQGEIGHKYPLRYWLERIQERLLQSTAPVLPLRPEQGLQLYRYGQCPQPLRPLQKIFLFGLSSDFLNPQKVGDYWLTDRERQMLSGDFTLRSAQSVTKERVRLLRHIFAQSQEVCLLDAEYHWNGKESASIEALLNELGMQEIFPDQQLEPKIMGALPARGNSYSFPLDSPAQDLQLSTQSEIASLQISASALDLYSRCSFMALSRHRWKLQNQRQSDLDLWPDAMGIILHQAVKLLLLGIRSKIKGQGEEISVVQAVEQAWREQPPRGLMQDNLNVQFAQKRMIQILDNFLLDEREYLQRSGVYPLSLDDEVTLEMQVGDLTVRGKPDRVDQHEDGLFIIDYKTSADLPTGTETWQSGYRLQMPFYALAAADYWQEDVVGYQFIELSRTGGRSRGFFLPQYNVSNKKEVTGKLTMTRKNNGSLMPEDIPVDRLWRDLRQHLEEQAASYSYGTFAARPLKAKECYSCTFPDLCGLSRRQAKNDE